MIGRATVRLSVTAALSAVVLIGAGGCWLGADDKEQTVLPKVSLSDMQARVRQYATGVAADVGTTLPPETRVGPVPCEDPKGDAAEGGQYHVVGNWQVPLPSDQQRSVFRRVRDTWQAKGYTITEYRELPDGVKATIIAHDPAQRVDISLASTEPPEGVALAVTSTCVVSPDGRYPG